MKLSERERKKVRRELEEVSARLTEREYRCQLMEQKILSLKGKHWRTVLTSETIILGEEERKKHDQDLNETGNDIEQLEQELRKAQDSTVSLRERMERVRKVLDE